MNAIVEQGGPVLIAIFALSMVAWALIVWKWLELRRETGPGVRWADEVIEWLARDPRADGSSRLIDDAVGICRTRPNLVGRLMTVALETHEPKRRDFEKHIRPVFEAEAVALRQYLNLIAAMAAACPLLGLLGTVVGMVRTFEALTGGVQSDHLAGGIGQALITTQAGLVVGLPLVLAHGYLASRIERYVERSALCVKKAETALCRD